MSVKVMQRIFSFVLVAGMLLGFTAPASASTSPGTAPATPMISAQKVEDQVFSEIEANGQTDFFVWMRTKADLSKAAQLSTKEAKGQYVFDTLRATAEQTQKSLRSYLDGQGANYRPFYIVNAIFVEGGNLDLVMQIAARTDVASITSNPKFQLEEPIIGVQAGPPTPDTVEPNISFIGADDAWALGVTGIGTVMAGNDTGLDVTHPAIAPHYRGCLNPPTCDQVEHNYNWYDAWETYLTPYDDYGHGTHTTGTMVGDDGGANQIGVAPGAQTVHCKNMQSGSGDLEHFIICFEWDLAPTDVNGNNPLPEMAPDAVNNSWGFGGGGVPGMRDAVNALQSAGIAVEVSAGNEGSGCQTLRSPGDYQEVLTTGSVNHAAPYPGTITGFSSRGPSSLDGDYFPDIMAPGENIRSALPGNTYEYWGGTSMAGPHATALIGLMWSACPDLAGLVESTYQIIIDTAAPLTGQGGSNCGGDYTVGPNNDWGYGTIDAFAAVQAAIGMCGDIATGHIDGHVYDVDSGLPIEGASVNVSLGLDNAGIDASTDPNGYYTMTVMVGTYDVTASKTGYQSQTVSGVEVVTDTLTTQDFDLTYLGMWTQIPLPTSCPDWYRYDAEYFPGTALAYLMGGRPGTDTDGSIYSFDATIAECADTGVDLPVPISNYTIVPLTIGGTDVLCTFGGRDSAGGYTNAVQCYDPIANTVSQPTTLPASIAAFIPGGAAGIDNKAYVFGGFNNISAPYNTAETWEWDPATDTWTQMGDALLGMGYMQVAVANGLIYSFGGDTYDGASLVAQTISQVFDPATGIWPEIAPLATASGEGRAYGFDNNSPYEYAGKIVIAGGGIWSSATAEALIYDIATDTYDVSFPDLNTLRRDHAGVFIPGDPGTMWVIGGWAGADTPPFGPPEYYPVSLAIPTIGVDPTVLDELVFVDTPKTVTLDVLNTGGGVLTWTMTEIPNLILGPQNQVIEGLVPEGSVDQAPSHPTVDKPTAAPDALGDLLFEVDFGAITADNQLLGVEFDGTYYWVTGGNSSLDPNKLYKIDTAGTLVGVFDQASDAGWGWRDLAFDGTYLYASDSGVIEQIDPATGLATGVTITSPINPARALAYDPATDHFWAANWDSNIYEFDRSGVMVNSFAPVGLSTYGMAWDSFSEGGPFLWLWSQDGPDPLLMASQLDPTTGLLTGVSFLGSGVVGEMAGGAAITDQLVPGYAVFLGANQGVSDRAGVYELTAVATEDIPWLSEDPTSGVNDVEVAVTFDPTGLPLGEYYGTLRIDSTDENNPTIFVPVTMTIAEPVPVIGVDPTAVSSTQLEDEIVDQPLTISNLGNVDLEWMLYDNGVTGGRIMADWYENFDSYEVGSNMHGQGDWKGWGNNPDAGALVSDAYSYSPSNSVAIAGTSDLVHEYSGYTSGMWAYTAMQYIPSTVDGITYFILLNSYDDACDNCNWSLEMQFDTTTDTLLNDGVTGGTLPIIYDQWVEIYVEIDLDADTQSVYYGGDLLFSGTWTDEMSPGDGALNIAAVDLYANGATEVYYDDISLVQYIPPEICEVAGDIPWLSVDPESGVTPAGESSDVAVTFDATGVAPGTYSDFLCAASNDPATPVIAIPVTITVIAKEAGVLLTPETAALADDPGATVTYNLTLENTGNIPDTFTVEADSDWVVNLPVTSFDLGVGETADFVVEVTIPADAMAGEDDVATVTATSAFDDGVSDSSALTTSANQIFGIELAPATAALSGAPGDVMTYTLTVTNTGNGEDTIDLALTGNVWTTTLPVASFVLAAGESAEVTVLVTIPADAVNDDFDVVTVTATSEGGPTTSSELTTTAVVVTPEGYFVQLPIVFK